MPDGANAGFSIVQDALDGLLGSPKTLPAKLLYDEAGCELFSAITMLPEYYPTRTELEMLRHVAPQLAAIGQTTLVEYGASDEAKASILLSAVPFSAYIPIDVAESALSGIVHRMQASHPSLTVQPLLADFLEPMTLPLPNDGATSFGFFPGSTIGNLDPATASKFLRQAAVSLGAGCRFLIGVDLWKSAAILIPAYDDAQGVTAAFNLNLLTRLNREAAASFDLRRFRHRADWNSVESRIEMHIVSDRAQSVLVAGRELTFAAGESIHTESSYKHTIEGFAEIAAAGGWIVEHVWTDPEKKFSLQLLRQAGEE